jgi:hypothetical protein
MPSRVVPKLRGSWKVWPACVWRWFSAFTAGLSPSASTSARCSVAIVTPSSGAKAPPFSVPIHPCFTATAA